ncbi:hypothetical protein [Mucilaginibacter sp.]|uniref:hypothetical protein n=1 Tax=Mucilaginibacter sp. TaxID=1882438 RepID=UPI0032651FE1
MYSKLLVLLLFFFSFNLALGAVDTTSLIKDKPVQGTPVTMGNNNSPVLVAPLPRVIKISTVHTTKEEKNNAKADAIMPAKNTDSNPILSPQVAYPGNIVRFTISHPLEFLKIRPRDQSRVVIYINGVELKGMSTNWYSSVTNLQINNGNIPGFRNDTQLVGNIIPMMGKGP